MLLYPGPAITLHVPAQCPDWERSWFDNLDDESLDWLADSVPPWWSADLRSREERAPTEAPEHYVCLAMTAIMMGDLNAALSPMDRKGGGLLDGRRSLLCDWGARLHL